MKANFHYLQPKPKPGWIANLKFEVKRKKSYALGQENFTHPQVSL
jgi:hypothetical protein